MKKTIPLLLLNIKKEIIQLWNELSSRFSELERIELIPKKRY